MKTILVPVDFSDATLPVVDTAALYARAFGASLILLHVAEPDPDFVGFEPGPMSVRQAVARDFRKERARLEELKARCGLAEVLTLDVQGPSVAKILEEAQRHDAGLIVMGSHGHGAIYELLVGSVTHGVLKGAPCPVLVVPAQGAKS